MTLSRFHLQHAVRILKTGGIIAYPTEAVFGLGCDPFCAKAVHRLLAIKQRPVSKGLILIASEWEHVASLIDPLTAEQREQLASTWPGFITWLLPARQAPVWLRGDHASLAVRITAHPVAAALCHAFGGPLVSTSANRTGRPPARTAYAVRRQLGHCIGHGIDKVINAPTGGALQPSPIRDLLTGHVVRKGS